MQQIFLRHRLMASLGTYYVLNKREQKHKRVFYILQQKLFLIIFKEDSSVKKIHL